MYLTQERTNSGDIKLVTCFMETKKLPGTLEQV